MILDQILDSKRREVQERQRTVPLADLRRQAEAAPRPTSFADALAPAGVSIIAEFKRRSPSGGELRPGALAADLASQYAANGAAALSVLTDGPYFGGSDDDLVTARHASGLPVLRKDFVVDAYQVYEARLLGASAVLLIVRSLAPEQLRDLLALARSLGLDALVETHAAQEVESALAAGAQVIGVNNRDLDTLVTDTSLALRLRSLVPSSCLFVAESGLHDPAAITSLREAGVDAALIGEALVRSPHPGTRLADFLLAGRAAAGATHA